MAKNSRFPRVEACTTLVDIRHLLSRVRWKSPEYRALILRWRELCRIEMDQLAQPGIQLVMIIKKQGGLTEALRELYQNCPSGSLEEVFAYGAWQSRMPFDGGLVAHRK